MTWQKCMAAAALRYPGKTILVFDVDMTGFKQWKLSRIHIRQKCQNNYLLCFTAKDIPEN